jgi:hypothetical protein
MVIDHCPQPCRAAAPGHALRVGVDHEVGSLGVSTDDIVDINLLVRPNADGGRTDPQLALDQVLGGSAVDQYLLVTFHSV